MDKTNKKHSNLFLIAKLILFAGVILFLFFQLKDIESVKWKNFQIQNWFSLLFGILLVFFNIGIAYQKWAVTINVIQPKTSFQTKINSFFAGVATGFVTPNMLGNFLGRMFYFPTEKRPIITVLTQFSNFGQFVASVLFGTICLILLDENFLPFKGKNYYLIISSLVLLISLLGFFFFDRFLKFLPRKWNLNSLSDTLKNNALFRWKILGLSLFRFLIFTTQLSLIIHAFTNQISFEIILGIWLVYLITLLFPSLVLGKLGVKESISIIVLSPFFISEISIICASLVVWLVNSCLPSIVGIIIYRKPNA